MTRSIKSPIKIFIVDDHEVVRLGVKNVLDRVPEYRVVGQASTSQGVVDSLDDQCPDLVLLDVRLPDEDGFITCEKILAKCPKARVLFLTSFVSSELVQKAVLAGAFGYVLKAVGSKSLLDSIEKVVQGESTLDALALKEVFAWIKGASDKTQELIERLSPQESRTLSLVAEGKTNKEIASILNLSNSTIKNYLAKIFDKLGVTRRAEAATLATKALLDKYTEGQEENP